MSESATVTVTRSITAAAGVCAPGHLGELTQFLPFELVDDVLSETKTVQRRLRDLPSRVGVYFVLALMLFSGLGYTRVWRKLTAGLWAWSFQALRKRHCGICADDSARRLSRHCSRSSPDPWDSHKRPGSATAGCAPSRSMAATR
jgi:hypothetical protein